MRKILENLFHGNITPNAKQFIRNTDFDRAMEILFQNEMKATGFLKGEEKIIFGLSSTPSIKSMKSL